MPLNPAPDRLVIYTGNLRMTVANQKTAQQEIGRIIQKYHGYVQNSTLDTVQFRVPPAHFRAALGEVEALGQVDARMVNSEDVTEAYADLKLRTEVAEASRQRLMALLDKTAELADILRVEQDIRRLTQEIEQMKGAMRAMEHRIEFSTINVTLAQRVDQATPQRRLDPHRFPWMRNVGVERVLASVPSNARLKGSRAPVAWVLGDRFDLAAGEGREAPADFSVLRHDGDELIAATPEDFRLRVRVVEERHENTLGYWSAALKEELARNRGYIVKSVEPFELKTAGLKAERLRCQTAYGGEGWQYDVWLVQREGEAGELLVIEYVESDEGNAARRKTVEEAIAGLRWRGAFLWE